MPATSLEQIVSLAKRRGFVFPSSAVYGGLGSTWDYGPLGVELKNNVKRAWWRSVVYERDDMEGLDAAILMNRLVWKYSGHEATFSDPMTDCRSCKARPRADHVFVAQKGRDPQGAARDQRRHRRQGAEVPEVRRQRSDRGAAVQPDVPHDGRRRSTPATTAGLAYLRPETAQGIFVNFGNVLDTMRRKLPFGVAQIGKAFRNEITPGNFTFRTREFEQMEIEYFVRPGEDEAAHQAWIDARMQWYVDLGMRRENLRQREQDKTELAHYAKRCVDLEYKFPMGWSELEGIANRTDYDLKAHSRSPENPDAVGELKYFDQEQKKHIVPYVIEPSAGADRATLAFLCDAFDESLVKEPPAEETAKLRELVLSFAKSVDKKDPKAFEPEAKARLVAAAEKIAAGLPGHAARAAGAVGRRGREQDRGVQEGARRVREAGRGVHAHGAAPAPAPGADHGGRLPAEEERAAAGGAGARREEGPAGGRPARRLRRHRRDRKAVPPPGRDRHAVLHHRRLPEPGGQDRHRARPRHDGAGAGRRRRARAPRCAPRSGNDGGRRTLTLTLSQRERGPELIFLPLPLAGEGRGEGKPCERRPLPLAGEGRGEGKPLAPALVLTTPFAYVSAAAVCRAARPSGRA